MRRIYEQLVVERTFQTFLYNFQKPVSRYLLTRLQTKSLEFSGKLKKVTKNLTYIIIETQHEGDHNSGNNYVS